MEQDGKKIWWIFFFLGMGTLLPWNFFITPFNYWMEKLLLNETATDTGEAVPEMYQAFWNSTMALATMSTNFIMCFVTTMLMNRIGRKVRFVVPIVGIGICFAIAAVYTKINSLAVPVFFAQTMINVVIITAFCAILQSSLFGHGAEIGGVMPAIMGGQGVGGIMASVTDILAKLLFEKESDAAMLFFVIPAFFMIFTGLAYMYLQKLPEYQDKLSELAEPLEKDEKLELNQNDEKAEFMEQSKDQQSIKEVIFDFSNGIATYMFCVFFTFTITLGLFPAVLAGVKSVNYTQGVDDYNEFYERFFLTICVFLLFNVSDTVGRMSSGYFVTPKSPLNFIKPDQQNRLLILVLLRVVLIFLMPKCNIFPEDRTGAIWFKSDLAFILLMILFGVTNGLFSSIAMSYAPQRAPEHSRERIGGFMGTVLVGGLFAGATSSFLLVPLAKSF